MEDEVDFAHVSNSVERLHSLNQKSEFLYHPHQDTKYQDGVIEHTRDSPIVNAFCAISHTWGCEPLCVYVCVKNTVSGVMSPNILRSFPIALGNLWKSHFPEG